MATEQQSKYIVIEGLDGSGKSTQFDLLLKEIGDSAIGVREPGGSPMAEKVRELIKDGNLERSPRTNLYLFSAARADLVDKQIRPLIKSGKHVVSDRNWLSTVAYQAAGENVNMQEIIDVTKQATQEFFKPDLVLFIDVSVATCRKRISNSPKHGGSDYFDNMGQDFFERLRSSYLEQVNKLPSSYVVNGEQGIDKVHSDLLKIVRKNLVD